VGMQGVQSAKCAHVHCMHILVCSHVYIFCQHQVLKNGHQGSFLRLRTSSCITTFRLRLTNNWILLGLASPVGVGPDLCLQVVTCPLVCRKNVFLQKKDSKSLTVKPCKTSIDTASGVGLARHISSVGFETLLTDFEKKF
jgi:NAD-dependent dihydropyrimidine dehydrogenase PreA subunit